MSVFIKVLIFFRIIDMEKRTIAKNAMWYGTHIKNGVHIPPKFWIYGSLTT